MVRPRYYPPADRRSQWYGEGGIAMPRIDKLVLHTTESAGGWPDYQDGAITPTLTYEPWSHRWRQHLPIDGSARGLLDPVATAVRENRDGVVQLEISCYCDPRYVHGGHHVSDLDPQALDDLGAFVAWLHRYWGLPLRMAQHWLPYPASAGASPVRMSGPAYHRFRGVLGHQHVSGNDHGDPGSLDVAMIMSRARARVPEPAWSLDRWRAADPPTVAATCAALARLGLLAAPEPSDPHDPRTVAAVKAWQRSIGNNDRFTDGEFGPRQWRRFWEQAA